MDTDKQVGRLFRLMQMETTLAEVAVPRELFAAILDRIQRFGVPPPLIQRG